MQQLKDYHWVTSPLFFITAEILWGIVLTKFWQKFGVKQSHIFLSFCLSSVIVRAGYCRRTFFISCHKVSIEVHYFLPFIL
ncbi:unnamed protein product [Acanthoscelides obtectus]|uniref:Uncharacterized protein n=1 Tax=Acanthoscelides obtectus TaxID=200917 RepID=A0A9P0KQX3_ACAOB|nr:unnamed protein product [Acanthoscelides obtectus]CAK1657748.1 hypothetical protein AOBTE_LOCUS20514 [Acanthoscelides obtectus]